MTENLKRNNKYDYEDICPICPEYLKYYLFFYEGICPAASLHPRKNATRIDIILNLKKDAFIYLKPKYPLSIIFRLPRQRGIWRCRPVDWPDQKKQPLNIDDILEKFLDSQKKASLDSCIKKYRNLLTAKKTTNLES